MSENVKKNKASIRSLLLCVFSGFLKMDNHKAKIGYSNDQYCYYISIYYVDKNKCVTHTFNKIELKKMLKDKLILEIYDFFRFIYLGNSFINDIE